jgi:chemotaxis protein methyltransferase CheR
MPELGIVDIREIVRIVKSEYDYDFGNYALTSFKQRLERLMALYSIGTIDALAEKLKKENNFFDTFLHDITVPSTEMFRDPSLWRWLREEYFPRVMDKFPGKFKIWLPACASGGELYSLAILLSESGLLDKVQIIASCLSLQSIEEIKNGSYDQKKTEISEENYKRFNGARQLSDYYKTDRTGIIRDTSLISQVEFKKLNINFDNAPQNVRLILFRNSMIYYHPSQQEKILRILYNSLSASGYLVIGIREKLNGMSPGRDFEVANEIECVYRKRMLS